MKITLVRNATLLLDTSAGRMLVDPMLDPAGARPPIRPDSMTLPRGIAGRHLGDLVWRRLTPRSRRFPCLLRIGGMIPRP